MYLKCSVDQLLLRIRGVLACRDKGKIPRLPASKEWTYLKVDEWDALDLKGALVVLDGVAATMRERCSAHIKLDLAARKVVLELISLVRNSGGGSLVSSDEMERVSLCALNPTPYTLH